MRAVLALVALFALVAASRGQTPSEAPAQAAGQATAIGAEEPKPGPLLGQQLSWENDLWAKGHTDRWYTNGIRYSRIYGENVTGLVTDTVRGLSRFLLLPERPNIAYTIGQVMYTPVNLDLPTPQRDDRPYGAFLYGAVTAHKYKDRAFSATDAKIGVTGPPALGYEVQSLVHDGIHNTHPQGWSNQLNARLGIQISHVRVYRLLPDHDLIGLQGGLGFALGSLRDYASAHCVVLVNAGSGGKDGPILVGNEGDFVAQDLGNGREGYNRFFVFAGISDTEIAYNYFITGPTPYGHSNLRLEHNYTTTIWGFSLPLQKWFNKHWPRFVYTQHIRSAEFTDFVTGTTAAVQRWGNLTANWETR